MKRVYITKLYFIKINIYSYVNMFYISVNYVYNQVVCDDDLTVKFTSNNWLMIYKKNKYEGGTVILTQRRWREEEAKLKYQQVKVVHIEKVNVGEACKDLFTFISTCTHCDRLEIDNTTNVKNVIDGREKNSELSCRLCEVLDRLHNLIELDIRDTDLSEGGRQVLSSISHPDLRVLTLWGNRLCGQGEELKAALTRLPHLRYLNLNDSGLGGEELLCGLTQLPSSSPLLQGLSVGGHDLSSGGDQLVQVVEALPQLRVLVIYRCQLVSSALCSILEKVNTNIEILTINDNGPVTHRTPLILDHINECKSLTYMRVSSSQFSKSELSQLNSLLSAHGGRLLVDVTSKHAEWRNYIKQFNRIRDECLSL